MLAILGRACAQEFRSPFRVAASHPRVSDNVDYVNSSCAENRWSPPRGPPKPISRGLTMVETKQTAESVAADDLAVTFLVAFGRDQGVVEPLMVPLVMIVLHEFADRLSKVSLAKGALSGSGTRS